MFKVFNNKNNKIILHKINGESCIVKRIKKLNIRFEGKNSTIEIWEPIHFGRWIGENRCKIRIIGDNNHIIIKNSNYKITSLQIVGIGSNNNIIIDENLWVSGLARIEFARQSNLNLYIGKNCMFGQDIKFLLGDYHKIYNKDTNQITNTPQKGITISNHVWIARNATILKDVTIPANSIVAHSSLVSKSFDKENIIIGGNPAKIIKENINWQM